MADFEPGVERWRPVVAKYWPASLVDKVLAVMTLESHGNPRAAYDGTATNPERSRGLMQINIRAWGGTEDDWFDPEKNIRQAYEIYKSQGWAAWYNSASILGLLGEPVMLQPGQPLDPNAELTPLPPRPGIEGDIGGAVGAIGGAVGGIGSGIAGLVPSVASLPDTIGAVATAIAQLPNSLIVTVKSLTATLAWLGQENIWKRAGLVALGAVLVVVGVVLFALSIGGVSPSKAAAVLT